MPKHTPTPKPPAGEVTATLLLGSLPFFASGLITVLLLALTHQRIPAQLLPGESLAVHGLLAAALVGMGTALWHAHHTRHTGLRRLGWLLMAATSLMAAPVLTMGLLPTLNGLRMGPPEKTPMVLTRLETTTVSKSRSLHHWAYLAPAPQAKTPGTPGATEAPAEPAPLPVRSGRFFIDAPLHAQWQAAPPATVTVVHARGLLGARARLGFE